MGVCVYIYCNAYTHFIALKLLLKASVASVVPFMVVTHLFYNTVVMVSRDGRKRDLICGNSASTIAKVLLCNFSSPTPVFSPPFFLSPHTILAPVLICHTLHPLPSFCFPLFPFPSRLPSPSFWFCYPLCFPSLSNPSLFLSFLPPIFSNFSFRSLSSSFILYPFLPVFCHGGVGEYGVLLVLQQPDDACLFVTMMCRRDWA